MAAHALDLGLHALAACAAGMPVHAYQLIHASTLQLQGLSCSGDKCPN